MGGSLPFHKISDDPAQGGASLPFTYDGRERVPYHVTAPEYAEPFHQFGRLLGSRGGFGCFGHKTLPLVETEENRRSRMPYKAIGQDTPMDMTCPNRSRGDFSKIPRLTRREGLKHGELAPSPQRGPGGCVAIGRTSSAPVAGSGWGGVDVLLDVASLFNATPQPFSERNFNELLSEPVLPLDIRQ